MEENFLKEHRVLGACSKACFTAHTVQVNFINGLLKRIFHLSIENQNQSYFIDPSEQKFTL